jgi:hypothetical protein
MDRELRVNRYLAHMAGVIAVMAVWLIGVQTAQGGGAAGCRTVLLDGAVELQSPAFVFHLDTRTDSGPNGGRIC